MVSYICYKCQIITDEDRFHCNKCGYCYIGKRDNTFHCNGCNKCIEVCQVDLLIPNPVAGKPPIILYPEECWYGGCCVAVCPKPGAIKLTGLPQNSVHCKHKKSGEDFYLKP